MSPLARQGVRFIGVGLLLVVVDSAVFVALTAAGLSAGAANPVARVAGALLGFVLNGRFTFAGDSGPVLGRGAFLRFATAWLAFTVAGTVVLAAIASQFGLQHAWWAKPLVEAALAVASFFLSRHWVYAR